MFKQQSEAAKILFLQIFVLLVPLVFPVNIIYNFIAGKTQCVSFGCSNNSGANDVQMDGFVLYEKSLFKMLKLLLTIVSVHCGINHPQK